MILEKHKTAFLVLISFRFTPWNTDIKFEAECLSIYPAARNIVTTRLWAGKKLFEQSRTNIIVNNFKPISEYGTLIVHKFFDDSSPLQFVS